MEIEKKSTVRGTESESKMRKIKRSRKGDGDINKKRY